MEPTLGEKIKFFRKELGYSQSYLELETDLAFGVLSRIENNLINPTKETILKISTALNLDDSDVAYLLSLQNSSPSEEEVKAVREKIADVLGQEIFPMYLNDNKLRVWDWNKLSLKFFQITPEVAEKYRGVNVMKILFSRELKVLQKVPYKYLSGIVKEQVSTFKFLTKRYNLEDDLKNDIFDLQKYKRFKEAGEGEPMFNDVPTTGNFVLQHGKDVAKIKIVRSKLFFDSRFMLIQYYPKDVKTAELFERLREDI